MEMASTSSSLPGTVEEIFQDFSGRRGGIIRALTHDVDKFFDMCDPEDERLLCLYGYPNESWEVALPVEKVPPMLPEPVLGINVSRDGIDRQQWLMLVALHSDSWLLAVAFYLAARLNRNEREHLFSLINDLPTIFEVMIEHKPAENKHRADSGNKSSGSAMRPVDGELKRVTEVAKESLEEHEDEQEDTQCGSCGANYHVTEFWIGCDVCDKWYHGECVKITPAEADSIERYECPYCITKGTQP